MARSRLVAYMVNEARQDQVFADRVVRKLSPEGAIQHFEGDEQFGQLLNEVMQAEGQRVNGCERRRQRVLLHGLLAKVLTKLPEGKKPAAGLA